ncbi:hypothetical protein [uncultured Pseudoalteromonas sp.]|uniref:nuclear transport factor 2 family protein n=2 Tax=Pseudoalteromonas TaxID=53246 RepID=UPI0026064A53|nr:hypothetical protein [uncultured Pseudoalteromonas sp.]
MDIIPKARLLLLSVLVVCTFQNSVFAKEEPTPKEVVTVLLNAMKNNNEEQIRAVFADNASQEYERWYKRKNSGDRFKSWLESDIINVHGQVIEPVLKMTGNQVVVTGTYKNNDGYSSPANFLLVVEQGKIVSWTMRYD